MTGQSLALGVNGDLQFLRPFLLRVDEVKIAAALIDDALAVGGRIPQVEILMIGVLGKVRAVRKNAVKVAHSLVVGAEIDPIAHPERSSEVALEL